MEDLDLSEERIRRIREAAQTSMGVQLGEEDLEAIRQLARAMSFLYCFPQVYGRYGFPQNPAPSSNLATRGRKVNHQIFQPA